MNCESCGKTLVEVDNPIRREVRHRRGEEVQCPAWRERAGLPPLAVLPPDAVVEEVAPIEHIHLRVDPTVPPHAEELRIAHLEALDLLTRASDELLSARRRLMNAGYRDTHPISKDIDALAGWIAEAARQGRLHPDRWMDLCRNWGPW